MALSRIFHLYRADRSSKVGETGEKTLDHGEIRKMFVWTSLLPRTMQVTAFPFYTMEKLRIKLRKFGILSTLTFTTLCANSADHRLVILFLFFPENKI